jgi:hypothetical protein
VTVPHLRPREYALLVAVVAYGVLIRAWDLGSRPFWVDEAESSINALTILQHGLPVDHYLGLPLYENILTRPWPESAEYEFKDSSYSERGLAIYHGWLPLYAMAGSFALAGVSPDDDPGVLGVRHSIGEMRRRTAAGRLPAAVFGAAFLLAVFGAARWMYGVDAGWAAVAAGAVLTPAVEFARQARYYSPALALAAGCGLAAWRMVQRGGWRDFILGATLLVLLFHTHPISFVAACAAIGLTLPALLRHRRGQAKVAALAAAVAIGVLPWVWWTGFTGAAADLPRARSLLSLCDLTAFLGRLGPVPVLGGTALVGLLVVGGLRGRLPDRVVRPIADHRRPFLFLVGWGAAGLLAFVGLVPAVSFFHGRLVLTILAPGLLFAALLAAAIARTAAPRHSALLAPGLLVLGLAAAGQSTLWPAAEPPSPSTFDVIERLRGLDLRPGTRVYATPNHHLVLTFYTGMPVQSVAPVRKPFLDHYPGEVVILEAGPRYEPLTAAEIRQALLAAGGPVTEEEARRWEPSLPARLLREELRGHVAAVDGPDGPDPDGLAALGFAVRLKTVTAVARLAERTGNPMFKGDLLPDYLTFWQTFYYRFVNPAERTGPWLNYADRVREGHAAVLPLGWVLHRCPARPPGQAGREADD